MRDDSSISFCSECLIHISVRKKKKTKKIEDEEWIVPSLTIPPIRRNMHIHIRIVKSVETLAPFAESFQPLSLILTRSCTLQTHVLPRTPIQYTTKFPCIYIEIHDSSQAMQFNHLTKYTHTITAAVCFPLGENVRNFSLRPLDRVSLRGAMSSPLSPSSTTNTITHNISMSVHEFYTGKN